MPGGTNGLDLAPSVPMVAVPDSTEVALIGLVKQAMSEQTEVTRAGFEQLSKDIRQVLYALIATLGIGFLLMVAVLGAIAGTGVYLKTQGIEIHTNSVATAEP